jgi:hypothetical protein
VGILICQKCGGEIEKNKPPFEERLIRLEDNLILAASRWFEATCPKCGPVLARLGGHHSTNAETRFETLFPKKYRKRLLSALPIEERVLFKKTVEGKREPKDGELKRWGETLIDVQRSAVH